MKGVSHDDATLLTNNEWWRDEVVLHDARRD